MNSRYLGIAVLSMLITACSGSGNGPAAVNSAPTISNIANQNTAANGTSVPFMFTVSDEQIANLSFDVFSDNPQLLPDSGLTLSGSGAVRNITVTPTPDSLGDAFVTIIVTDVEGLSASTSFLLNVDPEQKSMQQFSRAAFATSADDEPELVNAVDFAQDADDDDFADLLAQ